MIPFRLVIFSVCLNFLNVFICCSQDTCSLNISNRLYYKASQLCNCEEIKFTASGNKEQITYSEGKMIKKTEYYSSGIPCKIFHYTDSSLEITSFFPNGEKQLIIQTVNGEENGCWQQWDSSGNPIFEDNYCNGLRQGKRILWYKDSVKRMEANYSNDSLDGELKEWYFNGKIKWVFEYSHGRLMNVSSFSNILGEAVQYGSLKNGNGTLIMYSDEDTLKSVVSITSYKNGLKNGPDVAFYKYPNDTAEIQEYKDGIKNGKFVKFHAGGQRIIEGFYINNKRDGWFNYFGKNNQSYYKERYCDDTLCEKEILNQQTDEEYFAKINSLCIFINEIVKDNFSADSVFYRFTSDRWNKEKLDTSNYNFNRNSFIHNVNKIRNKLLGKGYIILKYNDAKTQYNIYSIYSNNPLCEKDYPRGFFTSDMFVVITEDMKEKEDFVYILMDGLSVRSISPSKINYNKGIYEIWDWFPY